MREGLGSGYRYRGADRVGHRVADDAPRPWQARIRGFDLHTAVSARAGARERFDRRSRR